MKLVIPEIVAPSSQPDARVQRTNDLESSAPALRAAQRELEATFAEAFSIVDARTGEIAFSSASTLIIDLDNRLALLEEIAHRRQSEIIEDESPLIVLVAPLAGVAAGESLVAVGVFLSEAVHDQRQIESAAGVLGVDCRRAYEWSQSREPWPPHVLCRTADAIVENLNQRGELKRLRRDADLADRNSRETFAELELLHSLAHHLNVSDDESVLWRDSLQKLHETVPAACLAAVQCGESDDSLRLQLDDTKIITHGDCPISKEQLGQFVCDFGPHALRRSLVLNRHETALPTWPCPLIREMASVPIVEGKQLRGWLLALNHRGSANGDISEFGSVELRLLNSVATMLGIHGRNSQLYQRQSELFNSSVRALASAIDAKDCYTSGHSDRVARIAVRLAEQLGMSKEMLDTIYLGGLLHDIGKIGIEDCVLNKPGRLSEEEFEQIKRHPQYGYDILCEVRELSPMLPIVLHHHEAWNGQGYPHGLTGQETPLLARIVAVADALDAMTSDRPYRDGMSFEQVEKIFRERAPASSGIRA